MPKQDIWAVTRDISMGRWLFDLWERLKLKVSEDRFVRDRSGDVTAASDTGLTDVWAWLSEGNGDGWMVPDSAVSRRARILRVGQRLQLATVECRCVRNEEDEGWSDSKGREAGLALKRDGLISGWDCPGGEKGGGRLQRLGREQGRVGRGPPQKGMIG